MDDINLVIFGIYGILYGLGYYARSYPLIIASGILLIASGASLTLFSLGWINYTFSMLVGIFSIFQAIFLINSERRNNNNG